MRTKQLKTLISGKSPHIYVTRAATLAYQKMTGSPFETSRRALTERILDSATKDPENDGCFLVRIQLRSGLETLRIWTSREGRLLVVPKIAGAGPERLDLPH